MPHPSQYWYAVEPIRVVDGDTLDLRFDLGFTITSELRIRLVGIDAPEMRGADRSAGQRAREHLIALLAEYDSLVARTVKDRSDSFGRYLADIYGGRSDGAWDSITARMVSDGHAKWRSYLQQVVEGE